jgi:hypothetical protein
MGGNDQQVSPELLNKPVRPDEPQSSDPAVAQQLGLVKQKNTEFLVKTSNSLVTLSHFEMSLKC